MRTILHHVKAEKKLILGIIVLAVVLIVLNYLPRCLVTKLCGSPSVDRLVRKTSVIETPRGTIVAEVADTQESQERGLSGRNSIEEGRGMLFVFPYPGHYGFWMKDMNFPIDMIWINASGTVVYMVENARPESYPAQYINKPDASYVLEIGAEESTKQGIFLGVHLGLTGQN